MTGREKAFLESLDKRFRHLSHIEKLSPRKINILGHVDKMSPLKNSVSKSSMSLKSSHISSVKASISKAREQKGKGVMVHPEVDQSRLTRDQAK